MHRFRVLAACALVAVTACASHASSPLPAGAVPPVAPARGGAAQATLSVHVPLAAAAASAHARPAYISPSSAQLLVAVNGGAATTYGLTAQSPGCAVTAGTLDCAFSVPAPSGNDAFALSIEDAAGNVLSKNVVSATLAPGASTPVNVTLAGVPVAVRLVPGSAAHIEGTASTGYHAPGLAPEPLEAEPLDADGNVIVGPGAPTITGVTVTSGGAYASVASAGTSDPQAYLLTPTNATAGGRTVTVTATAQGVALADGTTSAPVSTSTAFTFTPALVVASGLLVSLYSVETGNLIEQFRACQGCMGLTVATSDAVDANGAIYVVTTSFLGLSQSSLINIFAPGATTPTRVLGSSAGIHIVRGIAIGKDGMLYAAGGSGFRQPPPKVFEFASGATTPTYTITGITAPVGIGVDGSGNVYLPDDNGNVEIYGPGNQSSPSSTFNDPSLGEPGSIAVDAAGDFYVSDIANQDIAYVAAGSTSVTQTLTDSSLYNLGGGSLMLDPSGNLWASLASGGYSERIDASGLPSAVTVSETVNGTGALAWMP